MFCMQASKGYDTPFKSFLIFLLSVYHAELRAGAVSLAKEKETYVLGAKKFARVRVSKKPYDENFSFSFSFSF